MGGNEFQRIFYGRLHPRVCGRRARHGAGAAHLVIGHEHDVINALSQGSPVIYEGPVGAVRKRRHIDGRFQAIRPGGVGKFADKPGKQVFIAVVNVFKVNIISCKFVEDAIADEFFDELFPQLFFAQDIVGLARVEVIIDEGPDGIPLGFPFHDERIEVGITQEDAVFGNTEGTG